MPGRPRLPRLKSCFSREPTKKTKTVKAQKILAPATVTLWTSEGSDIELGRWSGLSRKSRRADNAGVSLPSSQPWQTALSPLSLSNNTSLTLTWTNADQPWRPWITPATLSKYLLA